MAGLTITRDSLGLVGANDTGQSPYVEVIVRPQTVQDAAWHQFNSGLRRSLRGAGYGQPELIEEKRPPSKDLWRIVAPGVIVRAAEYQARYSSLNLPDFQRRMRPEVFRAFVRHIGLIEGPQNVDVNELAEGQDD